MRTAANPITPTGRQFELRSAGATARIAQVGASLRALTVAGTDLIPPYPADAPAPLCSGTVLVPWPNRIRDAVWNDRGVSRELAVTEPKLGNASHGLLRFAAYELREEAEDAISLGALVVPQTGYPYLLDTAVSYRLTGTGIDVVHTLTNLGAEEAPVALGTHPFIMLGDAEPEDLVLHIPAETYFETDGRMIPVAESPVDEAPAAAGLDLRGGLRLADLSLDTAFGGLHRDADGRVRSTLTARDGRTATLWQGAGFDYVQAFTTDRYPGQRLAVAIEPMTAPADAFNSGRGLRRLAPGETWELCWGIEFSPARG
ncbi:MAG: aldose 1-epimerase family protein [Leucobacter sp.]